MIFVYIVLGIGIGGMLMNEEGLLIGGFLGFLFARVLSLGSKVKELERKAESFKEGFVGDQTTAPARAEENYQDSVGSDVAGESIDLALEDEFSLENEPIVETESKTDWVLEAQTPSVSKSSDMRSRISSIFKAEVSAGTDWPDRFAGAIRSYFTEGNLPVRIGIIVLFFGVAFLLKYAADNSIVPIEIRLAGVIAGGLALLAVGWRLRLDKTAYALALQGGGVGIMYLGIFATVSKYQLLPESVAFPAMIVMVLLTAVLAILQNASSLAVLGLTGGFLAPILVSTGSGNHVALFSYYLLLNIGMFAIAWFKAWRFLNLLCFGFTFVIGSVWGFSDYNSSKFWTTEPFLVAFTLLFICVSVLFAHKVPPKLKGFVDGTLVFGVPVIGFSLQAAIVSHSEFEYGLAISAFSLGALYIGLSRWLWSKSGHQFKALVESYLSLGVVFTSLAIPFALDARYTSAAWALESAGLFWIGLRQNRTLAAIFALMLLAGGSGAFLLEFLFRSHTATGWPFLNIDYIGFVIVSFAAIISAYFCHRYNEPAGRWQCKLEIPLVIWGLLWWFVGGVVEIDFQFNRGFDVSAMTGYLSVTACLLTWLEGRFNWPLLKWTPTGLVTGLGILTLLSAGYIQHPFLDGGWLAWLSAFAVMYGLLKHRENARHELPYLDVLHAVAVWIPVAVFSWELGWSIENWLGDNGSWRYVAWVIVPAVTLWSVCYLKIWPFSLHRKRFIATSALPMVIAVLVWIFGAFCLNGDAWPLPYLPIVNPLDIATVLVMIVVGKWWLVLEHHDSEYGQYRTVVLSLFAGLVFIWLNVVLLRSVHHWVDIRYAPAPMWDSFMVQTSLAIFWTLCGLTVTVLAARFKQRKIWMVGAGLMGFVVVKLFLVDLASTGSIERIISFVVVGLLLLVVGYFSPMPPHLSEAESDAGKNEKSKQGSGEAL